MTNRPEGYTIKGLPLFHLPPHPSRESGSPLVMEGRGGMREVRLHLGGMQELDASTSNPDDMMVMICDEKK